MSTARRLHYSYAEYLDVERQSSVRHEYLDGEIYAMAGATPEHGILAGRVGALISSRLTEGWRVGNSDVKINVVVTGAGSSDEQVD